MSASARAVLKIIGTFLLFTGLLYLALLYGLSSDKARTWVTTKLSEATGADVRMAALRWLPPMTLTADGFEISKPGDFLLQSRRLTATITPLDLFSKTLHRLTFDKPLLQLEGQGLLRPPDTSSGQIALRYLNVRDGTVVLKKEGSVLFELPNVDLNAQNLNLGGHAGLRLQADVPQLDGSMELSLAGKLSDLEAEVVIRSKKSSRSSATQKSPSPTSSIMHLRARIHPLEQSATEVKIEGQFQNLGIGRAELNGTLDGRAVVDRDFTTADFTGQLMLDRLPRVLAPAALKLPSGALIASFAGRFGFAEKRLTLKLQRLVSPIGNGAGEGEIIFVSQPEIPKASLTWRDAPLEFLQALLPAPWNRWAYTGRAQLAGEFSGAWNALHINGVARGDQIKVRSENLKAAHVKFTVPFMWDSTSLHIREATFDLRELEHTTNNHWQIAATRVQASASSEQNPDAPLKIHGRFEAVSARFHSPDNAAIGENLAIGGAYELSSPADRDSVGVVGNISVTSGELLWGKFFGDLRQRKPGLDFTAEYFIKPDRLECQRCNIKLIDIGAVELRGSIDRLSTVPELRLEARSTNFSPGKFFDFFLRDTYNRQYPLLDQLAVRGTAAFQTKLIGTVGKLVAEGELALKTAEIRVNSWDWQVGPLALDLPFQIQLSEPKVISRGRPRGGTLVLERARFGSQSLGPIRTTLSLENNQLRFHEPIHLALFGGDISLAALTWPDVIQHPKQLSFSLDCKRVALEPLTQALDWPRFGGTLTGSIPEVRSISDTLNTNGEIQAELFGGRVRMNKLEVENPFSSIASIKLDAVLAGIQLEQLSQTFAFGRISGILEGKIDDLVVTAGQPAQFRADLHSVDRGAEQRISVEALNKITVLSSGQNAGALYSGLAGFFDSFRYSKLGFRAVLVNDQLTLRGVETRGAEEYLVVGSFLPPTVNIVSHTQNIAFSELLRRLQRIKSNQPEVK